MLRERTEPGARRPQAESRGVRLGSGPDSRPRVFAAPLCAHLRILRPGTLLIFPAAAFLRPASMPAHARSPCAKRDTQTPWPAIPTLDFLHATKPCAAPHSRSPIPKPGRRCPFFAHGTIPRANRQSRPAACHPRQGKPAFPWKSRLCTSHRNISGCKLNTWPELCVIGISANCRQLTIDLQ